MDNFSVVSIRFIFPCDVFTVNIICGSFPNIFCQSVSFILEIKSLFSSFVVGLNSWQNVRSCSANVLPYAVWLGRCWKAAVISAEDRARNTNVAPSDPDTSTMGMLKATSTSLGWRRQWIGCIALCWSSHIMMGCFWTWFSMCYGGDSSSSCVAVLYRGGKFHLWYFMVT